MEPAQEQINIVNLAKEGKSLVVKAFAGCPKTTTIEMVAKELDNDEVTLAEDLVAVPNDFEGSLEEYLQKDQAGELVYVAITRARYKVNLPTQLTKLLKGIKL